MNLPLSASNGAARGRWDGALGWTILGTKVKIKRHRFRVMVARHPGRVALQTFVVIPALFVIGLLLFVGISSGLSEAGSDHDAAAMMATLLTLTAVAAFIGSTTMTLPVRYACSTVAS